MRRSSATLAISTPLTLSRASRRLTETDVRLWLQWKDEGRRPAAVVCRCGALALWPVGNPPNNFFEWHDGRKHYWEFVTEQVEAAMLQRGRL